MTDSTPTAPDLRGFLEAAGRSLADAQGALVGDVLPVPPAVGIAEAELEVKAAMGQGAAGTLSIQPLSTTELRSGGISPGLVSTVRVRFIATAGELGGAAIAPQRSADEVADSVREREDVVALAKILGDLQVEPVYVAERQRWLVTARDPEGRVVREVVVADRPEEG